MTDNVVSCVSNYRKYLPTAELEVRLGRYQGGKFTAGVEREVFDQLISDMQSIPEFVDEGEWKEVVDYHFAHGNRKTRTRVLFNSDNMSMNTEHIHKYTISESTYGHVRDDEDIAFRVMTSQELPVVDALPVVCIPTHVRIKQRRCFEDVRNGVVAWKYEFSKTWSANSRSVVEQLQHMSPPVYEVECELVDTDGSYLHENDDAFISKSLVLKGQMMCGDDVQDSTFEQISHWTNTSIPVESTSKRTNRKRVASNSSRMVKAC